MIKSSLVGSALLAALLAWQPAAQGPFHELGGERIYIDYNATADEGAVVVVAESSGVGMSRADVYSPLDQAVLRIGGPTNFEVGVNRIEIESAEGELASILEHFPQGTYSIRSRTLDGGFASGTAEFSHELLAPPSIVYPRDGMINIPSSGFVVQWTAVQGAEGYEVIMEQGDSDGLSVTVPAGQTEFQIPAGVLISGMRTILEIVAIAPNGNRTAAEVEFAVL